MYSIISLDTKRRLTDGYTEYRKLLVQHDQWLYLYHTCRTGRDLWIHA